MQKKLFALTLAFILLCSVMLPGSTVLSDGLLASDASLPLSDEKVYCNATLEDDFADDRVVVVLSNEASTSLHTYTKADFSGIGCTEVQNLTQYTTAQVNAKLRGETAELQRTVEPNVITFAEFSEVDTESFRQILCLTLEEPGKQNVLDTIALLMKHPDVISAEPDYVISLASTEDKDPYKGGQWAIEKIQLEQAWNYTTGSSSVRVGVIDSGIDGQHPELRNKINVSLSRDYVPGQDITPNSIDDVIDYFGHGTHVAGIIGAATNNLEGISGTCFNIELVSLCVFDETGSASMSSICQAIDHAKYNSIPILNMSLGCIGPSSSSSLSSIAASLAQYSGLVVCAAGNADKMPNEEAVDLDNLSDTVVYPAMLGNDKILVVGATKEDDSRWEDSNWGKQNVDLFAPGHDILSCYPYEDCRYYCFSYNNDGIHYNANSVGYHYKSGTSMATPYVAGVAALILAKYPSLSATQIKERILGSTDYVYALNNLCVTSGRLNAYKAVHPHSFGHYNTTLTHHLSICTCGATYNKAEHDFEQVGLWLYCCTVCGYESDVLP